MSAPTPPQSPRLFLVDGYALIYRAFFAMIARPLTTSRGENTSAAWGVVNFLQRLVETHRPEYLGWVLDAYRIPILSLQGYEADDVMGTLARQSVEAGVSTVLVSGDKDFQQLVR